MSEVLACQKCGVPEYITSEHEWHNNGLIVQKKDKRHILIFIENDNLVELFSRIEEIMEFSIERIIMNTRRRASRAYMDRVIPNSLREMVQKKELEVDPLAKMLFSVAHVLGYGRFELVDYRYEQDEDDYMIFRIHKPYSAMLGSSDLVASCEAFLGKEMAATYAQVAEDVYDVKATVSSHPEAFKGRLLMKTCSAREGDIQLESCRECGAPRKLGLFKWDTENGIIRNEETGRRMVFFAPTVLEAVLNELEDELGDAIPGVVVEAQRRLTKNGLYPIKEWSDMGVLREQLALRGFGNLREFKMSEDNLSLSLHNAQIHLLIVGFAQGLFEMTSGTGSKVEWNFSDQGDLDLEVNAG